MRQIDVNLVMMDQISRQSPVDNLVSDEVAVFGVSLIKVRHGILQRNTSQTPGLINSTSSVTLVLLSPMKERMMH